MSDVVYVCAECGSELETTVLRSCSDGTVRSSVTWCPSCKVRVGWFEPRIWKSLDTSPISARIASMSRVPQ